MKLLTLVGLFGAGTAAENLFVSSYAGTVSSFSLAPSTDGQFTLKNTSVDLGCGPNPTWLTLDKPSNTLYCIDENLAGGEGSLVSYTIGPDSHLTQIAKSKTPPGPVHGVLYGDHKMALADYGSASVSAFNVQPPIALIQNISFPAPPAPRPVPDRQAASHPHEAITDPTGKYVLVPDLGADLVRVFSFDPKTGQLKETKALTTDPGAGPRHATFSKQGDKTYFYVVGELNAKISAYAVTYGPDGGDLGFNKLQNIDTLGGTPPKRTVAPAGITVGPENKFLTVSNRNDTTFLLPNPDPKNATAVPSDSIATYSIASNGTLEFTQLWPAGGSYPRNFAINHAGDKIAIGLQQEGRIVVMSRDVKTGLIGRPLAFTLGKVAEVGQITRVAWDE